VRAFKSRLSLRLDPAVAADLPDWLWDRLGSAYGDSDREALARAWLAAAPLDLRINPLKTTREDARRALEASGIAAAPTPYSPLGLRIRGRPVLGAHPLFTSGAIEVQDEGSQLVGYLVAPRRSEMIVDFCAGAGGKTLLLGALMRSQGRLYAFDTHDQASGEDEAAARALGPVQRAPAANCARARSPREAPRGKIDRVLVDAPCTGFGTLRRNPDLKWRQHEAAVAELALKQQTILAAAADAREARGPLVYATCSVLPDENEAVVDAFLAASPGFVQADASRRARARRHCARHRPRVEAPSACARLRRLLRGGARTHPVDFPHVGSARFRHDREGDDVAGGLDRARAHRRVLCRRLGSRSSRAPEVGVGRGDRSRRSRQRQSPVAAARDARAAAHRARRLSPLVPPFFLPIAIPLTVALAVIRLLVYAMREIFGAPAWIPVSERVISYAIWGIMLLHFTGVLPGLWEELDAMQIPLGARHITVFELLKGAVVVILTIAATLWLSG
jgi:16S rRNA C967 or C1407 C5-methylase (RsmB/RsmF family)